MNPVTRAILSSWPSEPGLAAGLCLTAIVFLRGWHVLHQRDATRWHAGQPAWFLAGLSTLFLALASPLEPFSFLLLQVHMAQHLLLMMAVPPLLWLSDPLLPLLYGLPAPVRTYWAAPLLRSAVLRRCGRCITHPGVAGPLFVLVNWLWHVPALYELAVRSDAWHYVQHVSFLAAAMVFWYPVVRPYPSRPRWSRWLLFPYLLLADLQNTALAALLTFSDRVIYPHYASMPRLGNSTALNDQAAAGVLMWVPGSVVFLVPLFWIATRWLLGAGPQQGRRSTAPRVRFTAAPKPLPPWDLLRTPGLGRFLRWRHARLCFQIPMFVLAALVVYDGFTGPQVGAMNLAGVLPWIHWRGLVIFGLLIVGNVFCMACPFMLPRAVARRLLPQPLNWPLWLRNKWLAVALLALFFWAYDAFSLWDSPWWTAWIVVGYFAAALVIDGFFRGAAFCKYVCPIGQFNFVQSLVSPWEIKPRSLAVCSECSTKDCIRGHEASLMPRPAPAAVGCELGLFVERKASNLDCTLCLACVQACPQDNIGLLRVLPGAELSSNSHRAGIGRFSKRPDLAALVLLLVFAAFANAAGMVAPVASALDSLRSLFRQTSSLEVITAFYFTALLLVPAVVIAAAAVASRFWSGLPTSCLQLTCRFAYALVPLGFAMWLSHYSFHFFSSCDAAIPAAQRFTSDLGGNLGSPNWVCSCCRPMADWLPRLEILALDVGLLLSLYAGYRIALSVTTQFTQAMKAFVPWAAVAMLLFAAGVWIVLQPMQMRGTISAPGVSEGRTPASVKHA